MTLKSLPILVASLIALAACGGGGGSSGGTTTPPQPEATNAGGIWEGTAVIANETLEVVGVITEDGEGRFVDEDGTQYVFNSSAGDDGELTVEFTAITQVGFTFSDGSTVTTGTLTGTVEERASIEGEYTLVTGDAGTLALTYNDIYERDATLGRLEGMWNEQSGVLTIDADGSFFEQNSGGCVLEGQATVADPAFDVYELAMTISACGEANGDYTGLGILTDFNATDDALIVQMNSDDLIFSATLSRL